jgi:hypothetical protein
MFQGMAWWYVLAANAPRAASNIDSSSCFKRNRLLLVACFMLVDVISRRLEQL